MGMIGAGGKGVLLYLRQEGQGAQLFREGGRSGKRLPVEDSRRMSTSAGSQVYDFRDYGIGAQILRDIGLRKMRLFTNSPPPRLGRFNGDGFEIVEYEPL